MDLSKLPKFSQTPKPANSDSTTPEPAPPEAQDSVPPGYFITQPAAPLAGGEVWFAAIVGLVYIFLSKSFPTWLICKLSGKAFVTGAIWRTGARAGQPVDYWELDGHTALSDMAIFLFGVAVLAEAIMYLVWMRSPARLRVVTWIALAVTVLATGLNLVTACVLWSGNILPLISILAVGFGGWMIVQQWALLTWISKHRATTL